MARSTDAAGEQHIRADLGRPETPEETAARKAENSRNYRAAKTPNNLVIALVASLAIVLFLVLVVVRPSSDEVQVVDYNAVAAQAQPGVHTPLATPALPPEWKANAASLSESADKSFTWNIGFVTLEQGIDPTAGWFAGFLSSAKPTGSTTIEGIDWSIYDQRDSDDPGNFGYSLAATVDGTDYLLHGSADDAEFGLFATALAAEIADGSAPSDGSDG
jgi:hypothetical protein